MFFRSKIETKVFAISYDAMVQWNCQGDRTAAFQQYDPAKNTEPLKNIGAKLMGGIMSFTSSAAANISRRAFRNLLVLWAMFMLTTVLVIMIAFGASKANAMEPLPLPKVVREIAPPEFTEFSQVPSQSVNADRCQSLLNKVHQDTRSSASYNSSRRPAGQASAAMVKVNAIKAYRQCMSQSALQELAVWRWSR